MQVADGKGGGKENWKEKENEESNKLLADTVELTETMLSQLSEAYDKQIAVVREDRREILAIIETLERKLEN